VLQSTASTKEKKSRKAAFVTFIDYGSVDSIPLEQLLPLDQVCAIILSVICFPFVLKHQLRKLIKHHDNTLWKKHPNMHDVATINKAFLTIF
jgi:hypothetical protein